MKKLYVNIFLVAVVLAVCCVSCQKDPKEVTLIAITQKYNNDAKTYVDDITPYWHDGDRVRINDADYTLQEAMGNSAQIPNVTSRSTGYCAIFPASIVIKKNTHMGRNPYVTLPVTQEFKMVGNQQRVDAPMSAFVMDGNTLQFHNLCSVLRVCVSNATNTQLPVIGITVTAKIAYLGGKGTATIMGDSTDAIVIPLHSENSHSVRLLKTDNTPMKTIEPSATETFDIVLPECSIKNDVTISVYTPEGGKSVTIENATWVHNTIIPVAVRVDELTQTAAELVAGRHFNDRIPGNAKTVRFKYNDVSVTTGTILSTNSSPYPIYGNMDGTTWVVSTPANSINANADCSNMFDYSAGLTNIDFGNQFNTSKVTNMQDMFRKCSGLTSLNLSNFNTSYVTTMKSMFYECSSLASLDLSSFNTSNVKDMMDMFHGCSSLTSLDLSSFNTSNVEFMSGMFYGCSSLTSLDLSRFNTSSVFDMTEMFYGCSSLTRLHLTRFNTSSVRSMESMFYGCRSLTSLNLASFNTSWVEDMRHMFENCSNLTQLNLYNFDMINVGIIWWWASAHTRDSESAKTDMCKGLAEESGACAIICTTATQTVLQQSVTGLVNSRISWHTH